jgi:hypothetical protein
MSKRTRGIDASIGIAIQRGNAIAHLKCQTRLTQLRNRRIQPTPTSVIL